MTPVQVSIALIGWERDRGKAARGISASHPQVIEISELGIDSRELRAAYDDARLHVPPVVFNAVTQKPDPV